MGWNTRSFSIGGVTIELPQSMQMTQTYEEFGGVTTHRMMSGASVRQTVWSRLKTTITVDGFLNPGLEGLDWKSAMTIKCGLPRAINSASNVIAIPANRRTDGGARYAPLGFVLQNGMWNKTTCSVVGNVATLGVLSGAEQYQVQYWPEFTAFITPPAVSYNRTAGTYSWTIVAEEN
jgi:hypothetical protein